MLCSTENPAAPRYSTTAGTNYAAITGHAKARERGSVLFEVIERISTIPRWRASRMMKSAIGRFLKSSSNCAFGTRSRTKMGSAPSEPCTCASANQYPSCICGIMLRPGSAALTSGCEHKKKVAVSSWAPWNQYLPDPTFVRSMLSVAPGVRRGAADPPATHRPPEGLRARTYESIAISSLTASVNRACEGAPAH